MRERYIALNKEYFTLVGVRISLEQVDVSVKQKMVSLNEELDKLHREIKELDPIEADKLSYGDEPKQLELTAIHEGEDVKACLDRCINSSSTT